MHAHEERIAGWRHYSLLEPPVFNEGGNECRGITGVPRQQTARFGNDSVHPFDSGSLHPDRGSTNSSGTEINRHSKTENLSRAAFSSNFVRDTLLLRCAQTEHDEAARPA